MTLKINKLMLIHNKLKFNINKKFNIKEDQNIINKK
jgi:hypothetical protein